MNFEKLTSVDVEREKANRIYPERAFSRIDSEIDRIKKIESGEIKKVELTEDEREKVLEFENSLGEKLEEIGNIKVNSMIFYPEYFLTDEGKAEFLKVMGIEISGSNLDEVKNFILENRSLFDHMDGKELSELSGKSINFCDDKLAESLKKTIDEDGEVDIREMANPVRVKIILNPADALIKIKKLRQFKKEEVSIANKDEYLKAGNIGAAQEKIRSLYRKKVNIMIALQAHTGIWSAELASFLGEENLTEDEKELMGNLSGLLRFEEIFSRYDRFIHGADPDYDENGMRKQVGEELIRYAEELEKEYIDIELYRDSMIREKGLDPEKIDKKDISMEMFSRWAEELLDFYGEKSVYPAEEFDPKRIGPAPDNKWQFVAREEYKSMKVNSKQKIIKCGVKNKSIAGALSVLLGHEFTHFMQAKNKEKIPLRLFSEKFQGFRSEVFAEGGAMSIQNEISKELFGCGVSSHPHYIRAMAEKLKGGTYLDCLKAFYDSGMRSVKKKKEGGLITKEDFSKEARKMLVLALNRVKRLFRGSDKLDQSGPYLTKSKDTVYAEQVIIMKKLKENGLENCAFVTGVNLDTLATLMEAGLINLDEIKKPDLSFIRKIWKEKELEYKLD